MASVKYFLDGVASSIDMFGVYSQPNGFYEPATTPNETAKTDAERLRGDWEAVGKDIAWAITAYEAQTNEQT